MKGDLDYVKDVLAYALRVKRYSEGGSLETFLAEEKTQDAVIRCFEVMGEATKRLTPEFRATHPGVPWAKIAGFRDVLIHGYDGIIYRRCWDVIEVDLPGLIAQLEAIIPPEEP